MRIYEVTFKCNKTGEEYEYASKIMVEHESDIKTEFNKILGWCDGKHTILKIEPYVEQTEDDE